MFKKYTLENGLRVILVPQNESLSTTMLVLVEAGSKYESKEANGISHFLEHMCFKGTKKRPRSIDISSELDGLGAFYNAFTSLEYTGYYAKVRPNHLGNVLDIISDIYTNQIFDPQEVEKEKGVVMEEINMDEDTPTDKVGNLFMEVMYGDQPAGWSTLGKKETVQSLTQGDLIKYHTQNYVAKSTIVVVSGKFEEKDMLEKIQNYFKDIPVGEKGEKIKTVEQQEHPMVMLKHKALDQTHMIMGIRAFDIFDERKYILGVLAEILGGSFSSRLFQKIREEMGAAYYIGAGDSLHSDHGFLAISAGVDNNRVEEVITAVISELKKLATEPVSEKELERTKERLAGNLVLSLETSSQFARYYGAQEVLNQEILEPEDAIKKVQAVTSQEIMDLAKELFQNSKLNLALIGPFEDKTIFENVLSF